MTKQKIKNYIFSLVERVNADDFFGMAAEMGFMFAMGVFPFLLFLMSMFGWLGKKSLINPVMNFLSVIAPNQVVGLFYQLLQEVMVFEKGGVMAIISFVIAIALASNAIAVISKGINRAYGIEESRPFWYVRILSVLMVFVNALIMFVSVNLIIFGKVLLQALVEHAQLPAYYATMLMILRWPVAFLVLYIMAGINYYVLPGDEGKDAIKRKSTLVGTLFFCFFWLLGSWIFSVYLSNFNAYNKVYGTIGAFAIMMVWLYYTSLIILVGAELNSQVYKKLVSNASKN